MDKAGEVCVSRSKRSVTVIALLAVLAIVLAACGSSSSSKGNGSSTTKAAAANNSSGTLTVGAEQDAACTDWIDQCASSAEGQWMMGYQTMPRAFNYTKDADGNWTEVPSPTLASMPVATTVNGKQVVTYTISPNAVWSDGQPITSEDFKYTWDQIAHGKNIYDPTGYDHIESVDTTNPKVAVVTFSENFGSWTQLFSADYGIFPSHILEGKNRDALDEERLLVVRRALVLQVGQGRERDADPEPEVVRHEAHDQEGDLQDPVGHRRRVPGLQVR